jgi:hypothetical protein
MSTTNITFKRGNDFSLTFTVQDLHSEASIAAATAISLAKDALIAVQTADPQVPQDLIDAQAAIDAAQATYDAAIIVDISLWSITSQIKQRTKLIDNMVITLDDGPAGVFTVSKPAADTAVWPIMELDWDIRFNKAPGIVSSETFIVDVIRNVT